MINAINTQLSRGDVLVAPFVNARQASAQAVQKPAASLGTLTAPIPNWFGAQAKAVQPTVENKTGHLNILG